MGGVLVNQVHAVRTLRHQVSQPYLAHQPQGGQRLLRRQGGARRAGPFNLFWSRSCAPKPAGTAIWRLRTAVKGTIEEPGSIAISARRGDPSAGHALHTPDRGIGYQGGAHRPLHRRIDLAILPEPYLPLGRMRVNVHVFVGQNQVKSGQRVAPFRQQAVIGLLQGIGQHTALNPPAVDVEGHVSAVGAVQAGVSDKALDLVSRFQVGVV